MHTGTTELQSFATDPRTLVCELCNLFYQFGWASGTGGGISIKENDHIFMAPSSVQKERLHPEDIFVLSLDGKVLSHPGKELLLSQCHPLFMAVYQLRNAGAVLHSHSLNAVLVTLLYQNYFKIQNMEMQKGISGHGALDTLEIPIIENTAYESELTESLSLAIKSHPLSSAILVRHHGVYIWGKDWIQAKTQAECYDYLFEASIRMHQLGLIRDQSN
jgi:methylthioribulose-1-phosphate dehydratase